MLKFLLVFIILFGGAKTPLVAQEANTIEEVNPFQEVGLSGDYKSAFIRMMLTLGGLIILVIITVYFIRKASNRRMLEMNDSRLIKVIEKRPLSPKSMLYVVEVGGKQMLVAESQLEVRSLSEIS